tara:strand:- start:1320 stop:1454 length:135 start_codon:yes stop_codon:yes gene_type:complete
MESELEAQLRSERALGMLLAVEIAGRYAFKRKAAGPGYICRLHQ